MVSPNVHNMGRRNSSGSPYLIPQKSGHKFPHHHHHHHHHAPHLKLLTSVPTLSRGFVTRRISEGETGRLKEQLNCEACGKGYKHISSLAKHLWEHTPEWNMTKKLLLSKHQQVQLLEAASILVGMNDEEHTPALESLQFSDNSGRGVRSYLISEYPPSLIPLTYSPMPGCVGGYFDVPKKKVEDEGLDTQEDADRLEDLDRLDHESDEDILGKME